MFSIDQNCHSLWDVVPKLQALARRGVAVRHFVEDIDVAFTQMGAGPDGGELRLARERFYRSGGGDWGAALFYADFLGAQPTEIREWEKWTGMRFPESGKYIVPGALVPVQIDCERDLGSYVEPNVWMYHRRSES